MKRANEIIAATFGWSVQEINDARYQATRTPIPVYASGEEYYCCPSAAQTPPKGWKWTPYKDQFFAGRENRTIYVAPATEEED